jgi:hypothetical protein
VGFGAGWGGGGGDGGRLVGHPRPLVRAQPGPPGGRSCFASPAAPQAGWGEIGPRASWRREESGAGDVGAGSGGTGDVVLAGKGGGVAENERVEGNPPARGATAPTRLGRMAHARSRVRSRG